KDLTAFPIGRTIFGRFRTSLAQSESEGNAATTFEELVVGLIGPDEVEIHCHGGKAAAEAICEALVAEGATRVTAAEWAYQQEADPLAAEALLALASARTERTAAILLDQYRGALRCALTAIDEALARGDPATAAAKLEKLLARGDIGLHLTQPWKI